MKTYQTLKKINVGNVSEMPSHWDVKKLKWLLKPGNEGIKIGPFGSMLKLQDLDKSGEYKVYGQSNVIRRDFAYGEKSINIQKYQELLQYTISPGDLVVTMMGTAGLAMVLPDNTKTGIMDSHLTRIRTNGELDINYLELLLNFASYLLDQRIESSKGSIMAGLNSSILKELRIMLPPKREQIWINNFVDCKTSLIDSLIAKNQKQIELLEEKKQAMINQAVTKGLDPNVKMKDSGIEWIGEIPKHWEVTKIRFLLSLLTDFTANGSFADLAKNVHYKDSQDYARLVRLTDIREGFNNNGVWINEQAYNYLSKSKLFGGEILLANVGAYSGYTFLLPEKLGFRASLAPNMFLLKFNNNFVDNRFMYYAIESNYLKSQLILKAISSAQPKLNKEDVRSCTILLPETIEEQRKIVSYLDKEIDKYNNLIHLTKKRTTLLMEYRQALISNVVTGKIDVRDEKIPEKYITN